MVVEQNTDGSLVVPYRAETGTVVGDSVRTVRPGDNDYEAWLDYYERMRGVESARAKP